VSGACCCGEPQHAASTIVLPTSPLQHVLYGRSPMVSCPRRAANASSMIRLLYVSIPVPSTDLQALNAVRLGALQLHQLPTGSLVPAQPQANASTLLYTLTQSLAQALLSLGSLVTQLPTQYNGLPKAMPGAVILKGGAWRGVGLKGIGAVVSCSNWFFYYVRLAA
jgi:hypothetical protein